jgi:hypothetical protein
MIIGICGYKGSGKSTVGSFLVQDYGFYQVAFADKLKDAAAALFGISREDVDNFKEVTYDTTGRTKGMVILQQEVEFVSRKAFIEKEITWREILQRLGTEVGRNIFGEDFWVNQVDISNPFTVITDVRFNNEAKFIIDNGGEMVYVHRPGYTSDGHPSEVLPTYNTPYRLIVNDGTVEELYRKVGNMMDHILDD